MMRLVHVVMVEIEENHKMFPCEFGFHNASKCQDTLGQYWT